MLIFRVAAISLLAVALSSCVSADRPTRDADGRLTPEAARAWRAEAGPLVGINFVPSTAVNELEMWQADTFDPVTIDRELGYAEGLGFDVARVFLHDKLWTQDAEGFLTRIETYLSLADAHGIRTIFVLMDNVWNPTSSLGPQPEPIPGVHNSRWVQSPEKAETLAFPDDSALQARLRDYVQGVIGAHRDDSRVVMWDLLNEPGNSGIGNAALPLLTSAFAWARELRPRQPITSGLFFLPNSSNLTLTMLELSDVVTFHQYADASALEATLAYLRMDTDRPLVCTEYMARPYGSTFASNLPVFLAHDVGAVSWGLVSGRTQTIYPWLSPMGAPEPAVWFHDILRADGTPFDPAEVTFLRTTLGVP